MTSTLRSLIKETLLQEEVWDGSSYAVVYHGTHADPLDLINWLLKDQFIAGSGEGSKWYGNGFYAVYNYTGSRTSRGDYGKNVIKFKVNLDGYIIFDMDVAKKVYGKPLTIVQQAQMIGVDDDTLQKLKNTRVDYSDFTSESARYASSFLRGRVKGLVYTGRLDGNCIVCYDHETVTPFAWKKITDPKWNIVDLKNFQPERALKDREWKRERYGDNLFTLMSNFEKMPESERVVNQDMNFVRSPVTSLPDGLKVNGKLGLSRTGILSLPRNLYVKDNMWIDRTKIQSLPPGMKVGGNLDMRYTSIMTLPNDLQVGGMIIGFTGNKSSVPSHLRGKIVQ